MTVKITFFAKDSVTGKQLYTDERKPLINSRITELPFKFGYGSYNEPRKLLGEFIDADDLISIEPYTPVNPAKKALSDLMGINGDKYLEEIEETNMLSQQSYDDICANIKFNGNRSVTEWFGLIYCYYQAGLRDK